MALNSMKEASSSNGYQNAADDDKGQRVLVFKKSVLSNGRRLHLDIAGDRMPLQTVLSRLYSSTAYDRYSVISPSILGSYNASFGLWSLLENICSATRKTLMFS